MAEDTWTDYFHLLYYASMSLLVTLVLYAFHKYSSNQKQFISCNSSTCVRCYCYNVKAESAKKKCIEFSRMNDCNDELLRRLRVSIENNSTNKNIWQQPDVLFIKDLQSAPFWCPSHFSELTEVLAINYDTILSEFDDIYSKVMSKDYTGWKLNQTPTGCWSFYFLLNQGELIQENSEKCPETMSLLKQYMMVGCVFGNVGFSVIYPGTVITEHCGPCNSRIRCHFGLKVPAQCHLTVSDETRTWQKKKCLYFDDSYFHSVEYLDNEDVTSSEHTGMDKARVVLLIDLWHPGLADLEKEAINYIYSN